jgi:hypothetical protein
VDQLEQAWTDEWQTIGVWAGRGQRRPDVRPYRDAHTGRRDPTDSMRQKRIESATEQPVVPTILVSWLAVFRPCFTAPVWNHILVLIGDAAGGGVVFDASGPAVFDKDAGGLRVGLDGQV